VVAAESGDDCCGDVLAGFVSDVPLVVARRVGCCCTLKAGIAVATVVALAHIGFYFAAAVDVTNCAVDATIVDVV
jgi:hypothetical protein